jgi:hypothetical protein
MICTPACFEKAFKSVAQRLARDVEIDHLRRRLSHGHGWVEQAHGGRGHGERDARHQSMRKANHEYPQRRSIAPAPLRRERGEKPLTAGEKIVRRTNDFSRG